MSAESIKAAASFWPILLIVIASFWLWYFRRPIRSFLEKVTSLQVKRGQTELLVSQPVVQTSQIENLAQTGDKPAIPLAETSGSEDDAKRTEPLSSFQQLLDAAHRNDMAGLETAFDAVQQAESDAAERSRTHTFYLYLRFSLGDTSALDKLRDLTKEESFRGDAYFSIGACYEKAGQFSEAAEAYKTSTKYRTGHRAITSIVHAARNLFNGGRVTEAYSIIMHELASNNDSDEITKLYEGLAKIYELANEPELRAFALEMALEGRPNDTNLHFGAAWSYSNGEKQLSLLSVLHYKALLGFEPDNTSALNNLGVQYHHLELPLKSVRAYLRAAELDETLAAANLAQLYLKAGFAKEASAILDVANKKPNAHANVARAISALAEKETSEEEQANEFITRAREQQRFMSLFAKAFFIESSSLTLFEGVWRCQDNGFELTISQTGNKLEGTFDRLVEQLSLEGEMSNSAARCNLSKKGQYFYSEDYGRAYLILSQNQLDVLTVRGSEHSLMVFTRAVEN